MKREVTKSDWSQMNVTRATTKMLESVIWGQSPNLHFWLISELYKLYRIGPWKNLIPDPATLEDKTYLLWQEETYCLFHAEHPKFGKHIVEVACPYAPNNFVFFDYAVLGPVFQALDEGMDTPYIPIHHASIEDRHDYITGEHQWV